MSCEKSRHVRACVAFALCASMIFGMLMFGTGPVKAASDDAMFVGEVKVGTDPAPDTLVMYSLDPDSPPSGNSTVSDPLGGYGIHVDGGRTYYVYFANGRAMFDSKAQLRSVIAPGETKWLNASLTPAAERTVTLKGYLTNASDPLQPVISGHVLGLRVIMEGDPDYINWSVPDSSGYYEIKVLPGIVMSAVFDAPGYFPSMGSGSSSIIPLIAAPGTTIWKNMSLKPFTGYTVNVSGVIADSFDMTTIQGAVVSASLNDMGLFTSNETDSSGSYALQTVDGDGTMRVAADGYVSQRQDVTFSGDMILNYNLNKLDAEVYGYVLDESGNPIPNATVSASDSGFAMYTQYNDTISGPDGSYNLSLCAGDWYVTAQASNHGESLTYLTLWSSDRLLYNFSLLSETGRIKGYVTDRSTGLPIDNATVMIIGQSYDQTNQTFADSTGFYSISCIPDDYQMTFMAAGYMWETTMSSVIIVPSNATVWANHSLDPATVRLFGTVTDAVTGAPLSGVSVTAATYSLSGMDFMRISVCSSGGGNYSMMVAPDTSFTVIIAEHPDYEPVQWITSIPDVSEFQFNITLLPSSGVPEYLLEGIVTDSTDDSPLPGAAVTVNFGSSTIEWAYAGITGYYSASVPTVELTATAQADGYLSQEFVVAPGPPGGSVTLNFSLVPHLEPPVFMNSTVTPDKSISIHNHAEFSFEVVEPYQNMASLNLARVTNITGDVATVETGEGFYSMAIFGVWFGVLDCQELSPDARTFSMSDWDTTSDGIALLTDGAGSWETTDTFWTGIDGRTSVWGQYSNASLALSLSGNALFDGNGDYLGFDNGGGVIIPGTDTDDTGEFWMSADYYQFNLTTGAIEGMTWGDSAHLEAVSMHFSNPMTYPSGEYAALMMASDTASNTNFTLELFSIDNDPPVASAGSNQTETVGVEVQLNGTLSSDNVGVVNYTWTFDDGGPVTVYGPLVNYAFTTVGNHTVQVAVRDAAGYTASSSSWVNVLADQAPVAIAGPDQVVDEDTVVQFDGTGSHDDVGIVNYTWTVVELSMTLYGSGLSLTFGSPGLYHVRLVVTDTVSQQSASDEILISVSDTTPPVAQAGLNLTMKAGEVVTFDGSESTDNSGVENYTWTFTYQGIVQKMFGPSPKFTFKETGVYEVKLTVRDVNGLTSTDTVTVTVTKGATSNFLNNYWWLIAVIVVAAVAAVVVVLARKGKGPSPATGAEQGGSPPPPPPDSDELEFPPPNDEQL